MFILDTLDTKRSVVEEASGGVIIGTIFAQDIDGPEYNVITYSITYERLITVLLDLCNIICFYRPTLNTPADLIEIDPKNGVITVKENANIDCDDPPIEDLVYTVSLRDPDHLTEGEIRIHINDINNKPPTFGTFETTVKRYENITTGDFIEQIKTSDIDRDRKFL